ncbi:hypothetical protein GSbR_41850 [Geobacter sp. SVR]|nr:hypothetical protein GSVR_24100 [Geobacter sp. SVR]GCF87585.1 hypothetical protein GSbR_41850 [Geobacter sp. SVR]
MERCQICGSSIDQHEVYVNNVALIEAIESGTLETPTDLEQSIYLGKYCQGCVSVCLSTKA